MVFSNCCIAKEKSSESLSVSVHSERKSTCSHYSFVLGSWVIILLFSNTTSPTVSTLLTLFLSLGVCQSVEVYQSPSALLSRPGDKVQLVCSHEKTDYRLMQWYQKSPGQQALKRIGHVYLSNIDHEEPFKQHFNITGDMSGDKAKNGSLFITNLQTPEHTAVYYCAASYAH